MAIRPKLILRPDEIRTFVVACARAGLTFADPQTLAFRFARRLVDLTPEQAAQALQGLTAVSARQMANAGPRRLRIRDAIRRGIVVYDRFDPDEEWLTYRDVIEQVRREGAAGIDCEDLGTLTAAEMRADGWDPGAAAVVYRVTDRLSHVVVNAPGYGILIDPSRLAGMGAE